MTNRNICLSYANTHPAPLVITLPNQRTRVKTHACPTIWPERRRLGRLEV